MKLVVLGAGFSGKAIGRAFGQAGAKVSGTTRSAEKAAALEDAGMNALVFDGETISNELADALATATHLVQSIAPGKAGDPMFRPGTPPLETLAPSLKWVGYLSTVGVYGDHGGAWIDEDTPCNAISARSKERIEAEGRWLDFGRRQNIPLAVLRLAGIYGPGRNAFRNLADGTARRLIKKDQVFNRIRVEDIGAAALFLAERHMGGIFNIADHEPGPPQDVIVEAARLMGVEPPPEIPFETAELSPMARSFYGESKRVSSQRIREAGFSFAYPDYRTSLAQLWQSGTWRA